MATFQLKERDAGGRLGRLNVQGHTLETPLFLPVVNPNIPVVAPHEMEEEFRVKAVMTNAYIISRSPDLKRKALEEGIHRALGFNGAVFTDSGAYQTFRGEVEVTQTEIIKLQEAMRVDVGVMLDVPSREESPEETRRAVLETAARAEEWQRTRQQGAVAWEGVVQGGAYLSLVKLSCGRMSRYDFDIFAVGIPPRLWKSYEFAAIGLQGLTARLNLPVAKPLHAFGVGHPAALPLLVAVGYDIFDSASYSLYARDGRYLTELGTRRLAELEFLPCNCPECQRSDVRDLQQAPALEARRFLAKHNLHSILREVNVVKQAIHENRLWDLVYERARAHPKLLEGLKAVLKAGRKHFEGVDPVVKRSPFMYYGRESRLRPELTRALRRVKERLVVGPIPSALRETYPFGQAVSAKPFTFGKEHCSELERSRTIADYQFGRGIGLALFPDDTVFERSRSTGRIRRAWLHGELLATLRPHDGLWVLRISGAGRLHAATEYPRYRAVVTEDEEVQRLISLGANVFSRFVVSSDPGLIPGEETLVVTQGDGLLGVGRAVLSGREMTEFRYGVAVETREGVRSGCG
ncbi:MAG: tRNA guanosine(15) transglycosylase TgtA [Candidatus Bathyarchaeia archaeon]